MHVKGESRVRLLFNFESYLDVSDNYGSELFFIHLDHELEVAVCNGLLHSLDADKIDLGMRLVVCKCKTKSVLEEIKELLVVLNDKLLLYSLNNLLEQVVKITLDNDRNAFRRGLNLPRYS